MIVGLAIIVGLAGIVVPVLPGSIMIGLAIGVWAIATGGWAWAVFAAAAVLLASGSVSTYVLAARHTRAAGVPGSSLAIAGVAGIVGFFLVPVIGLLLFFPLGLFGAEYLRLRDSREAVRTAGVALRAVGLGMLIELGTALLAAGVWLAAVLWWLPR
ncbi:MAG TPA: DUF456 domain-containing protein [Propionicimonas sp.]|jgi:uncharacterized protein YqgC (DUF456 family)|nr:DUF456 domain-containing protein [Propionicimonas sp.]